MNLSRALRLLPLTPTQPLPKSKVFEGGPGVAFVGAGGKSTAMFQLARELPPPVIVTATTHLGVWQTPLADRHIIATRPAPLEEMEHNLSGVMLVTGEIEAERTKPLDNDVIKWLHEFCGYFSMPLLIEADGSRQKPLKAPGEHEPPIPDFVKTVVVVAGLSGLGKPLDEETAHRPEIFGRLIGLKPGETITAAALMRVLTHPEGGLKNIPESARRIALLNQADTSALQSQAESIAKDLLSNYHSAIIASLKGKQIYAVHEPIAGIVLAAGEAQRYGQPKQLLDWRGEPFVRAVAKTALESGLSPVIVVTGAYADQVETAVVDLPVQVAHNPEWQSGQASSIRAGLIPLPQNLRFWGRAGEGAGGAIFLLADQPQVTPAILHALVEEHASTLAPIIAPMVLDQRANPVLFDRVAFPDLMKLEGDVGGRGIFSKHRLSYLTWHDDAMLLDVDTPEHYQRLKDLLE
ncbi:MAG: selenium cofactor biosynthesis protein YqeC [Anaerolineales bacterium]